MNLILLPAGADAYADDYPLSLEASRHVRDFLKGKVGDSVRIGIANGHQGIAILKNLDSDQIRICWTAPLSQPSPPPLPLRLFCALPRPKVFRRVVQAVVSLGVKEIHFFQSYKVEKSYWQSPFLEPDSLQNQIQLGLEQAKDTCVPQILFHSRFKPFAEDILGPLAKSSTVLLASPAIVPVPPPSPSVEPLSLVIGPEGGFTPYEEDFFLQLGAIPFSLGTRVLKVETAIPALIGALHLL